MVEVRKNELDIAVSISRKIPEFTDPWPIQEYERRLKGRSALILTAYVDSFPVGFKIGYSLSDQVFYSWMGGILPQYRRSGLATHLMQYQENWCCQEKYRIIRVKTRAKHSGMRALLTRNRYREIDREKRTDAGETRLVFEKTLLEDI